MRKGEGLPHDILNAVTDPVFVKNREHRCVFVNDAYCRFIGYPREALLDKTAYDFFPESEAKVFHEKDEIVFTTGVENVNEESFTDGSEVKHAIVTKKSLYKAPDGHTYLVGIIKDVTAGKAAEAELRKTHAFLDSIIENIPNMIFVKDAESLKFVRINRAGERLLGLSRDEFIGKSDYDFFPKKQADFFTSKDRQVLAGREVVDVPEETIRTREKGERVLHTQKVPVFDDHGRAHYLLGISEDITELRAAEAAVREKESLEIKSQFLSMVSHELRTPLQSIREGIAVVLEGLLGAVNPKQTEALSIAKRNVDRLTRLINDVLDIQRLDMSQAVDDKHPYDLNELVLEIAKAMDHVAKKKGLLLETELGKELPQMPSGRDRMAQVLLNLVNNAVKFTDHGVVSVSTRREDRGILVSVQDTGIGIKAEDMPRVFTAFGQIHSQKNRPGGTGLGLVISKKIIEQYGGRIWVESVPDKGSRFTFWIPAGS